MAMKFWLTAFLMIPIIIAKVTVDVAIMMQGRFNRNCSVRSFLGMRYLMASRFRRMEMIP